MRVLLLLAVLSGVGCSDIRKLGETSCSDPDGLVLVTKLVVDHASNKLADEKDADGDRLFDSSAIRAELSRYQLAVADIRTDKTDPNSTKVFCKGSLKVTLPVASLSEVDDALRSIDQGDLTALAGRSGVERNANVFTSEIEYTLQPTDDKKSIYAEVPQDHASGEFIRWVAGSQLVASMRRAATAEKSIASAIPMQVEPTAEDTAAAAAAAADAAAAAADAVAADAATGAYARNAGDVITASFPCDAASTPIEKAICSDAGLADLDRAVGLLFERAQRNYPNSDVRGLQLSWLRDVRNACGNVQCLHQVYADRKDYFVANFPSQ